MYIRQISVENYGPIESLDYSFRFTDNGNPIPLVLIGKNGSGKTLLFTNIIDAFVETKRCLYPSGIMEVCDNNYYKIGSHSYIKNDANTSKVYIECAVAGKIVKYLDVMSKNIEKAISNGEVTDKGVTNDREYRDSGFYRSTNVTGITSKEFERSVLLYFPFDRFYRPMWYNANNYNKISTSRESTIRRSRTNLIKADVLENVSDWLRNVYMQLHSLALTLPNQDGIPEQMRGKQITGRIDTSLQSHLRQILSVIKDDGGYSFDTPNRNSSDIGIQGSSIHCSNISQLSAGEIMLYAIALSIIKEWDLVYSDDSVKLEDISGCVVIDEADANLHIDFAYRALPALMKLFPKIQFVLSTHSPFLLAGLKKQFGDNIDFLSLPTGDLLYNINSFSEITDAYRVFNQETEQALTQLATLKTENERLMRTNDRIIIYTEGKTDVKYLKQAFEHLDGFEDIKERIEYYDIEHAQKTGDGELAKIFDYLQKGHDSNIKICMFDRDKSEYIFPEPFLCGANKVYKFNIPIPNHRTAKDLISIEHCLSDSDLRTVDADGRRIFMSGEFDFKGLSLDGKYMCMHTPSNNPLEILDGSNAKKVYLVSANDKTNYALTKDDFVRHIIDKDSGYQDFSFEGFRPILNMIRTIVEDAENLHIN